MAKLAVVGSTGYTGRLIVAELRRRGASVVAVGRDPTKLATLPAGVETRLADAGDPEALRAGLEGCGAVVSCIPAFTGAAEAVAVSTMAAGAHYIDTASGPSFVQRLFQTYGAQAAKAGVALVPGVGFSFALGDLAAALAARALGRAPGRVDIAYLPEDLRPSKGSQRTGLRTVSEPCYVWGEGRLMAHSIGAGGRRFGFPPPFGPGHVALWPSGEVVTAPRHTGAQSVCVYMRMSRAAAAGFRALRRASPVLGIGRVLIGGGTGGPTEEERRRARFVLVAEASTDGDRARAVLHGQDPYGLTAVACAEALLRMATPAFAHVGALAPAEAFAPEEFLAALVDHLSWRVE